jgi:hypothetical protein
MDTSVLNGKKNSLMAKASSMGLYAAAGAVAAVAGIASTFALDYNMAGPALDASAVTGFKAGIGDSIATIQTSLNNAYLTEIAIMFIGFAVIVGVVMHVVKGHRRI